MWPVLSGILIAVITAAATVYMGRWSKSGRIERSEAKELWDTLRSELARLQVDATAVRAEASVAHQEMMAVREEAIRLRSQVFELEMQMSSLVTQLAMCHREEEVLRGRLEARTRRRRVTER